MTIRWTPTALRDLESVHTFLFEEQPVAANATVERILAGIQALSRYPELGKGGRVRGTREFVAAPFVVAYKIRGDFVEILAIIHGARRWPESF